MHRQRQPVQLQLRDVLKFSLPSKSRTRPSKSRSSPSFSALSRLSIGDECATLTKPSRGLPPTRWVGESSVTNSGCAASSALQLPHHHVVLGVRDFRRVQHVIKILVMRNFLAQRFDFLGDGTHREVILER